MRQAARMIPNEQLRWERQRRGWSREYVAEQISIADPKTIGRWERGVSFPSAYFLQKLCNLFGMQAQQLGLVQRERSSTTATTSLPSAVSCNDVSSFASSLLFDPAIPQSLEEIGGLVGRDELLSRIEQRLLSGRLPNSTALHGLPGVGKTALAVELAYDADVQKYFSDGILWVSLGPKPDLLKELERWGELLGITKLATPMTRESWARLIRTAIGMRRMLLIIDNAWTSEDALAFKIGGPNCAYLLTTRLPVVALHFAGNGSTAIPELDEVASLRLLEHFAPALSNCESGAVQELVQLVGGLPLALNLMGKYLQSQSYNGQLRRLRSCIERLHFAEERLRLTVQQTPLEKHSNLFVGTALSLQAIIETSYCQLNEVARDMLSALSVFAAKPQSFSEEAALAVSHAPVEALDALVDAGLLEGAGAGRYTLHRTIIDCASTQRVDRIAEQRFVEYFIGYVEAHEADSVALEQEYDNILKALQIAFVQNDTTSQAKVIYNLRKMAALRGNESLAEVCQNSIYVKHHQWMALEKEHISSPLVGTLRVAQR